MLPLSSRSSVEPLRYHDFQLRAYSVQAFGKRIEFDLVFRAPDSDWFDSRITFSDVVCYRFTHPSAAIITEIDEVELQSLVSEEASDLTNMASHYGLTHWRRGGSIADYTDALQRELMRAWRIESAIGFEGFVIAKNVVGQCTSVPRDRP